MINFCSTSIILKMALIFKFQTIASLIFYSGDDNPPPPLQQDHCVPAIVIQDIAYVY